MIGFTLHILVNGFVSSRGAERKARIVSIRRMWFGTIFDPVDEHDVSFLLTPTKVI